jgi:transcriptional regulator with XRE-family HTH domain
VDYDAETVASSSVQTSRDVARRQELGDFLRSRRAAIKPEDIGIPAGPRRRTPGLRREELAQIAGVGVTWYTWLEQGREINVSDSVLLSLARALRLTDEEVDHLLQLGGATTPPTFERSREVTPAIQHVLDAWTAGPAYVTDARFDIIARNESTDRVFGDFGARDGNVPNYIAWLFVDENARRCILNWEEDARRMLGVFRATAGRYAGDPEFAELIDYLVGASELFAAWWPQHDVRPRSSGHKLIARPDGGCIDLEHTSYLINGLIDCSLVLYVPAGPDASEPA